MKTIMNINDILVLIGGKQVKENSNNEKIFDTVIKYTEHGAYIDEGKLGIFFYPYLNPSKPFQSEEDWLAYKSIMNDENDTELEINKARGK